LTNKKIGDDLIVDGRITLTGENDPSTLLCKISPFGFGGGDIIAENNLSCSGILDCSNNAVIHKIGDISIGDVTTYDVNNPALAHKNFVGTYNGFGMLLQNTGKTIINAIQGQEVSIRNNNTEKFRIDTTYSTIYNNLRLQNGYIDLSLRGGTSFPNGVIRNVEWTSNTLPTGFTKNDIGGGYSTQLINNSGYDRTLVMGGNLTINGGTSGFLLVWLGQGSNRISTFTAPLENGSTSVTISFTYKIPNGATVFFQAYQNSGATRTLENSANRRSIFRGQVL